MKKAAKWIALAIAVLALLLGLLPVCKRLRRDWKQHQENKAALRGQWEYCLKVSEWMDEQMLWAFDYAGAYARDNTWENLLKARAACSAAKLAFQQVELQGTELAQEQYLELMKKDIEAGVVLVQYDQLETELWQNLVTLTCLETLLTEDVFLSPTALKLSDWVENCRQTVVLESQYLGLATNYLLLQLGERQWGDIPDQFPIIGSCCGSWSNDSEQLQTNCADTLDALAKQPDGEITYSGISEFTLSLVEEAGELTAYLQPISDVPGYFPAPAWLWKDTMYCYLVSDPDTQESRLLHSCEELTQAPEICYIRCGTVSLEEVKAYEQLLDDRDVPFYGTWNEEEGTYQILALTGECNMMVEWSQDETILYLKSPIACLIPGLYFAAMQGE
ncbi:MAG: hypothetical protein ACI3XG_00280 [Faecousia sp.]